jgi:hypothetical protein
LEPERPGWLASLGTLNPGPLNADVIAVGFTLRPLLRLNVSLLLIIRMVALPVRCTFTMEPSALNQWWLPTVRKIETVVFDVAWKSSFGEGQGLPLPRLQPASSRN